jgi:anti-anti-sigma factor
MSSSGGLNVEDVVYGRQHTLVLEGELDLVSASSLEARMRELCANGTKEIVLDLGKLTFIDSTGVRAVLLANELCERHSCDFSLTHGTDGVQHVFELTGLLEALPFTANGAR